MHIKWKKKKIKNSSWSQCPNSSLTIVSHPDRNNHNHYTCFIEMLKIFGMNLTKLKITSQAQDKIISSQISLTVSCKLHKRRNAIVFFLIVIFMKLWLLVLMCASLCRLHLSLPQQCQFVFYKLVIVCVWHICIRFSVTNFPDKTDPTSKHYPSRLCKAKYLLQTSYQLFVTVFQKEKHQFFFHTYNSYWGENIVTQYWYQK